MSVRFDPAGGSVRVSITVAGPRQNQDVQCSVDTGSTHCVLPATILRALGYDLSRPVGYARVRGATGVARAPLIRVAAVAALDRVRSDLVVAAHDFPLGTTTSGLLGLDFFRGLVLKLDFARGIVRLDPPRRWWQFWR